MDRTELRQRLSDILDECGEARTPIPDVIAEFYLAYHRAGVAYDMTVVEYHNDRKREAWQKEQDRKADEAAKAKAAADAGSDVPEGMPPL